MDSGIDPLLLPKNKLAFARNGTLRGDYLRQRPAYNQVALAYADGITESDFQSGLFQGIGYYQPDSGPESIALQVGGRQFLITPDPSSTAAVKEITIPGDPDPPTQPQAWIKQAENFLIFNDGISLPVFYDGATSRRSFGQNPIPLGTLNIAFTPPAVGSTISITLNDPYTGPFNQTTTIGGEYYIVEPTGGAAAFNVLLKNLYDPDTSEPKDSLIVSNPNQIGITETISARGFTAIDPFYAPPTIPPTVPLSTIYYKLLCTLSCGPIPIQVGIGSTLLFSSPIGGGNNPNVSFRAVVGSFDSARNYMTVYYISPSAFDNSTQMYAQSEWRVTLLGNSQATSTVGVLAYPIVVVPAVGQTVAAEVYQAFTGQVGQIVWINGGQFQIMNITALNPAASNVVTVENLSDTSTAPYPPGTNLYSLAELPPGRAMDYGMGMLWEAMPDGVSFLAGDIVNSESGSPQYNDRDSVLKVTQNTLLSGGGLFRVPGNAGTIQAMKFIALLDVSLGQGPLQIFTPQSVFACSVPADRTKWQTVTNPILTTSLIGAGGVSQDSVTLANGDIVFRASDGSIRSLLMARLDFDRWANTPISREMQVVIDAEDDTLLAYSTSCLFDNRMLFGTGLTTSGRGIYSNSLIAMNLDPVSSLAGEADTIYDGQWNGLNVLRLVSGSFRGVLRCFAVCLSEDLLTITLNEILPSDGATAADYDNGNQTITQYLESPPIFGPSANVGHDYLRLSYGEIYVDELVGPVLFQSYYKPDKWPDWVPWYSWIQPFDPGTDPGFRPRVGLPMPDGTVFDTVNNRPLREGFNFQFKLVATGKYRFVGARFSADIIPQPEHLEPLPPYIPPAPPAPPAPTPGVSYYLGSPIPTATFDTVAGISCTITPGVNENGVVLMNGTQTVVLATGVPVTIIAQGNQIAFRYPNLIQAGAMYSNNISRNYLVSGLVVGPIYNIVFGANDSSFGVLDGLSFIPFIANPGAGKVATFVTTSSVAANNIFRGYVKNTTVTAELYMASAGLPLTAMISSP